MRVGVFGGGFKPFTTGHFSKLALALRENDLVILFYALAARTKGSDFVFTKEMAKEVFDVVKPSMENAFGNKIRVELGKPTPIVKTFKLIEAIKDGKDNSFINLTDLGIDADSVDALTIYSDPDDIKNFTRYIGTDKEEKYFGNLVGADRLKFDSGLSEDDNDISRMIVAMKDSYPNVSDEELEQLIRVRGSDVRASISSRDRKRIARYLPNFLTEDEKDQIINILMKGLVTVEHLVRALVRETIREEKVLNEKLEAHILNFYEDFDMPLAELYEVIDAVFEGKLEDIEEKMDGQNVTFTVIDGELQFFSKGANWGRVQRGGINRQAIETKYHDRPSVRDAFLMAYDAIRAAVKRDPENSRKLFQNGQVLVESALLAPNNPNTIVYDDPHIRFIQAEAVGPDAEVDRDAYQKFISDAENAATQLEQRVEMGAVPLLKLKRSLDGTQEIEELKSKLDSLISSTGVKKDGTMGDLAMSLTRKKLEEIGIPKAYLDKATERIVMGNKKALTKKDIVSAAGPDAWSDFQSIEKERSTIIGEALIPIERIIQELGAYAFRNLEFALASNDREAGEELRGFVRKVRNAFESGKVVTDPTRLERIRVALARVGDNEDLFDKAVEGIVFRWKGKTRKLTGLFTPINKLRGFFHYGDSARIEESSEKQLRQLIRLAMRD
jgi:hypothetical protein